MQRLRRVERLEALTYDEALATQVLVDDPDGFAARLREVEEEIGLDGILAELNCGGKIPQERGAERAASAVPGGQAALPLSDARSDGERPAAEQTDRAA